MFNVGGGEIMVILLLALLVLGPDKLPEYARKAGRFVNEFRRMTSGFEEEFRQAMDLSELSGTPASETPSSPPEGDAIHRATEGPRLLPRTESPTPSAPTGPALPEPPPAPAAASPSTDAATAATAEVTPASRTGPELITPSSRPTADHEGDPGSSSAA